MTCSEPVTPLWHKHLQELPVFTTAVRLAPADRTRYADAIALAYRPAADPLLLVHLNHSRNIVMTETIELHAYALFRLDPKQAGQASRVYRGLRSAIISGEIPPGTMMASKDLETGYKVSPKVVAAALKGLTRDGLTSTRRGSSRVITSLVRLPHEGPAAHAERIMRGRLTERVYPHDALLPPWDALATDLNVPAKILNRALAPLFEERLLTHCYDPIGVRVATSRAPLADLARDGALLRLVEPLGRKTPLNTSPAVWDTTASRAKPMPHASSPTCPAACHSASA